MDGIALLFIYGVVAAVALAFAWPWLSRAAPGGPMLARYAPLRDGAAALTAKYDAAGTPQGWTSHNVAVFSPQEMPFETRPRLAFAIAAYYRPADESALDLQRSARRLADFQLVRSQSRLLDVDGRTTAHVEVSVREPRGDLLFGYYDPDDASDVLFDPPALILPSALRSGAEWDGQGRVTVSRPNAVGQSGTYAVRGRVLDAEPYAGHRGALDDCVRIRVEMTIELGGVTRTAGDSETVYCAGVGPVEARSFDAQGVPITREVVVAGGGLAADPRAAPPPAVASAEAAPKHDVGDWRMTRVGRARPALFASSGTIPPTWLHTEPALLLVAGRGGDLVAFDASDDDGRIAWRFHPAGTIYGPPAFDPVRGRVYFGTSDKRLYALDVRGMFLWSFDTEDSIASRPVVAGDTVVFGSEDRDVYAVDADTGALRWREKTGGAVVSSPVLVDDSTGDRHGPMVVIGSDDGGAYALDVATGERRWLYTAQRAIEAPIVYADGVVYVPSRDGTLAAVDPATGEASWTASVNDAVDVIRSALRTAPALSADRVFVVDDFGNLTALDRQDGRRVWSIPEAAYVGPPIVVDETLLVARKDGSVDGLALDGSLQDRWTPDDATGPADATPRLALGPAAGGGALWLTDDNAVVRRLGPPEDRSDWVPLRLGWSRQTSSPPFVANAAVYTVADYRGTGVVLDSGRNVFFVDAMTGRAQRQGRLASAGIPNNTDPVVAGDTLLAVVDGTLHAARLPDGAPLWSSSARGSFPPQITVDGDTVLWFTDAPASEGDSSGGKILTALQLADGTVRWQAPLGPSALAGGAVIRDDVIFTSVPPAAHDLVTGELLWGAQTGEQGLGRPALSDSGDLLFLGVADLQGGHAVIALDTADGRELWRASLGPETPSFFERPWPSGDRLIVPTLSGKVIALDAASGSELWRYDPSPRRAGGITVDGGRVWLLLENGRMLALDAETGRLAARFSALDLSLDPSGLTQRPSIVGGAVVVPAGLWLLGFDRPE